MNLKDNLQYISNHNSKVLRLIGPYFDTLVPLGIWLVVISMLYEMVNNGFHWINYVEDFSILIALVTFYFAKDKLSDTVKMKVILSVVFVMGIFVSFRNGFVGNGIYLCISSIIASLVFLEPVVTMMMILIFAGNVLYLSQIKLYENYDVLMDSQVWTYQLIGIIAVTFVTCVSILALKRYLIDTFIELEAKVDRLKVANEKMASKNNQIEHLAYVNQLTHLYNRQRFIQLLQTKYISKDPGRLQLLDIANFKQINSFYGMKKGDEVLGTIGSFIHQSPDFEGSLCGYFGANSFAIWTPEGINLPSQHAFESSLNNTLDLSNYLNFYIVEAPTAETTDVILLFKAMEISMNRMKRDGKKRFVEYSEYNEDEMAHYDEMVHKIENAINMQLFEVYFQEKVNSSNEKVVGLEALARLFLDDDFISPGLFIPIIEDTNMALGFGHVIIEKVFKSYNRIIEKYGEDITVSINISPHQLALASFADELKGLIHEYGIDPTKIELEITENILIGDVDSAVEIISNLKAIGVKISIDDFGTGYSSLRYISDLPVDVIKIDKSFVDKIVDDYKTQAIVSSIIKIAEVSDYQVIAEGVELEEQVITLRSLGCHLIQGYFYSKPKPLD